MPDSLPPDPLSTGSVSTDSAPPETVRWQPDRSDADAGAADARPGFFTAIGRGLLCRCPNCGLAPAFRGYLKVVPECPACGAPLGSVRADDAPPYFTIFIAGHLLVPIMFWQDSTYNPSVWTLAAIWVPAMALACLLLLRPIKGATLGLMLRVGLMKPAGGGADE